MSAMLGDGPWPAPFDVLSYNDPEPGDERVQRADGAIVDALIEAGNDDQPDPAHVDELAAALGPAVEEMLRGTALDKLLTLIEPELAESLAHDCDDENIGTIGDLVDHVREGGTFETGTSSSLWTDHDGARRSPSNSGGFSAPPVTSRRP